MENQISQINALFVLAQHLPPAELIPADFLASAIDGTMIKNVDILYPPKSLQKVLKIGRFLV